MEFYDFLTIFLNIVNGDITITDQRHIQGGQRTSYIQVFFYRKLYNGENFSTI